MSRDLFRVGQRVRLVVEPYNAFAYMPLPPKGTHGTVIAHYHTPEFGWQWRVDFDGFPGPATKGWLCDDDEIEPVYDGDQPVGWADCAWRPQGVTQ